MYCCRMNEVILFRDVLFRGPHTHVFHPEPDLTQNVMAVAYLHDVPNGFSWNDQTSSIVVVEGTWIFYFDVNYGGANWTLSPGTYPNLTSNQNDQLSSLKPQ